MLADFPPSDHEAAGPTEWGSFHGVPGWTEAHPGEPIPTDPRYDQQLLRDGDTRNVVDHYRYWTRQAIIADLDTRRHAFHIAIENFAHDHNIGTVVRTANAFLADTVHIVGKKRWNRRGAMVTDRYQHIKHHADIASLEEYAAHHALTIIAVDNTEGSQHIERISLPQQALFLFGNEGTGLTPEAIHVAHMHVSIPQFGSTRSINVGVAAGIIMHQWIAQHANLHKAW